MKTMDIIFAISHLDIERTTEALLVHVVPIIINNRQGYENNIYNTHSSLGINYILYFSQ